MNIIINYIHNYKITSERELKNLFWKISKRIHPDATSLDIGNENFIKLKNDYDQAKQLLGTTHVEIKISEICNKEECSDLFIDLMACNFPIDKSIKNKQYQERISLLNNGLSSLLPDGVNVFSTFEEEMYLLKGETVISNHLFNVVKLYFYRYCDYKYLRNKNSKNYL